MEEKENNKNRSSYKNLQVWQKSIILVVEIYNLTKKFPKDEIYGLTSQIRRAVVSIPSNIAEGQGRGTSNNFKHFLHIAYSSAAEVETQLIISEKVGYISISEYEHVHTLLDEVICMLVGLMKSLNSKL